MRKWIHRGLMLYAAGVVVDFLLALKNNGGDVKGTLTSTGPGPIPYVLSWPVHIGADFGAAMPRKAA